MFEKLRDIVRVAHARAKKLQVRGKKRSTFCLLENASSGKHFNSSCSRSRSARYLSSAIDVSYRSAAPLLLRRLCRPPRNLL